MNIQKLKAAAKEFLSTYPGGFNNEHFADIEKKHKMGKLTDLTQTVFAKNKFKDTNESINNLIKLVGQSSMVSMFEKPKFRDFAKALKPADKTQLVNGLKKFLHDKNQQAGFEMILEVLTKGKLAKWSLITAPGAYFRPDDEVFIKPTTAKGVIEVFELKGLEYKPRPSWQFYEEYRKQINAMKKKVSKTLSPSNAAFSGFLMMSLPR